MLPHWLVLITRKVFFALDEGKNIHGGFKIPHFPRHNACRVPLIQSTPCIPLAALLRRVGDSRTRAGLEKVLVEELQKVRSLLN